MIEVNNLDLAFLTAKNPWGGEGMGYNGKTHKEGAGCGVQGAGGKDNAKNG
jgi:hypothetical protein